MFFLPVRFANIAVSKCLCPAASGAHASRGIALFCCEVAPSSLLRALNNIIVALRRWCISRAKLGTIGALQLPMISLKGVFPFRRMQCKLFLPSFSFLIPFINAKFMGVNEMHVKILPLLCRLGLVLRLGSV